MKTRYRASGSPHTLTTFRYGLLVLALTLLPLSGPAVAVGTSAAADRLGKAEPNPVDQRLWQALVQNDRQEVLAALQGGANVNVRSIPDAFAFNFGAESVLGVAIFFGDAQLVALLLDNGLLLERRDSDESALALAAWYGKANVFRLLLDRGQEIPAQEPESDRHPSLLQQAAMGGSQEIVALLLAEGYRLPRTPEGQFLLLRSAAQGSSPAVFAEMYHQFAGNLTAGQQAQLRENASEEVLGFLYEQRSGQQEMQAYLLQALTRGNGALVSRILGEHPQLWTEAVDNQITQLLDQRASLVLDLAATLIGNGQLAHIRPLYSVLAEKCGTYRHQTLLEAVNQASELTEQEKADFRGYALIGTSRQLYFTKDMSRDGDDSVIGQSKRLRAYMSDLLAAGEVNFALSSPEEGGAEETALRYAVLGREFDLARTIMATGVDLSVYRQAPGLVMAAVLARDYPFVGELLKAGASPEIGDRYADRTPLTYAVDRGDTALLGLLLDGGANPNAGIENSRRYRQFYPKKNAFLLALDKDNPKVVEMLLASDQIPLSPRTLGYGVAFANTKGKDERVRQIIAQIPDLNSPPIIEEVFAGKSVLRWALENNAWWLLARLDLQGKALIPDDLSEADLLCHYVEEKRVEMLAFLFEHGFSATVTCDGPFSLLATAAYGGDLPVIDLLLAHGADIDRPVPLADKGSRAYYEAGSLFTPLFFAINGESVAAVNHLLERGATTTALGYAEFTGQYREYQFTPLILAVTNGSVDIVTALLDHGADVNQTNDNGYSALMAAVENGNARIVRLLLHYGAERSLRHAFDYIAADRIKNIDDQQARAEIGALLADDQATTR
ncbi:MAG: ankyrin repeat domain-containing protein [Desulfopila sp.]